MNIQKKFKFNRCKFIILNGLISTSLTSQYYHMVQKKIKKALNISITLLVQASFFLFTWSYLLVASFYRFFVNILPFRREHKTHHVNPFKNIHSSVFKNRVKAVQTQAFQIKQYFFRTQDHAYVSLWRIVPKNDLKDLNKRSTQIHQNILSNRKDEPVLIMHGLLDYSYSWFVNQDKNKTLPYMLAKQGYDVWVGNNRGTRASIPNLTEIRDSKYKNEVKHLKQEYWDYTFDHLVNYDISTLVNSVLQETGSEKLYFVGHSQGGCQLLTSIGLKPEIKDKIKKFIGLGTLVGVSNLTDHGVVNFLSEYHILSILKLFGFKALYIVPNWMSILIGCLLYNFELALQICHNAVTGLCGKNLQRKIDMKTLALLACHQPGGASINNVQHWIQCVQKGRIRKFDYGMVKNLRIYGQHEPPAYNFEHLGDIGFECHFFLGTKDKMITEKDFQILLAKMDSKLTSYYYVQDYGHLDYLWSAKAHQDIYGKVVAIILKDKNDSEKF